MVNGVIAEHEQGSEKDVTQNAVTVMRYEPGQREAIPRFGIPDQSFTMGRVDTRSIANIVRRFEPDVEIEMVQTILRNGDFEVAVDLDRAGASDA